MHQGINMEEEKSLITKITQPLNTKLTGVLSWINGSEGKILTKTIAGLTSFVVGDPTGMLFPTILECADIIIRKRVLNHYPDLVSRLNNMKNDLNMGFVKSDFGQYMLKEILHKIACEENEEKIQNLKSFLISAYKQQDPNELTIRICLKRLLQMDSTHIQILSVFDNPELAIRKIAKENEPAGSLSIEVPKDINTHYLKFDEIIFITNLQELQNWGILRNAVNSNSAGSYSADRLEDEIIPKMTEAMHNRITRYGRILIDLLREDEPTIYKEKI